MYQTERYVYRISNASFVGWKLQIAGLGVSEWFSVAKYGSDAAARAAAIARRDQIFPFGVPAGRAFCTTRRTEGRVIGVSLAVNRLASRGDGTSRIGTVYWIASWGMQERKRYSVRRLGWEGAFRAACTERQRHTGYPVDPGTATVPDIPPDVEAWMSTIFPKSG